MPKPICSLDECDKPVKRRGYCYSHYMKAWRYGTPTPSFDPKWVDLRGRRFGTVVVQERQGQRWLTVCDCGRERLASAGELNRSGDAATCGHRPSHRRSETAGYSAAHDRVRRDRGPITDHACIDCGRQAQHWSYNHDDPQELLAHGLSVRPVAYSLTPAHYSPRCISCHKRFDLGRIHSTPRVA